VIASTSTASSRAFWVSAICFALGHFAAVWIIGWVLFESYGFRTVPNRAFYEASLGAGVKFLGLPDTVFGWLINSLLYGIAAAAWYCCWRRASDLARSMSAGNRMVRIRTTDGCG
jgi:hypothetical protein